MSSTAIGYVHDISSVSSTEPIPSSQSMSGVKTPQAESGIKQDTPHHIFSDDYDKRFPDDAHGEEISSNARVWRAYMEEAAAFDANMVGQSRDGLDVMLVFAGLFSAVVTSFLVQVSQNLQADYTQMTAMLIHDLVFIQLAIADGASVPNNTLPSVNPTAPFVADGMDIWVNGLWVVSLTASLAVALAAVLIKQWLHHYASLPSGTPRDCSQVRQFRFTGLELWRVHIIMGMLPIIMHLSLALFLSGLVLFLIPLRSSLAWAVGVLTVLLCTLYLISNALPILFPQCPYQTPLSDFLNYACQVATLLWHSIRKAVTTSGQVPDDLDLAHRFQSLMTIEKASVQDSDDKVTVDALDWLYGASSNHVLEGIVLMAIGGLQATAQEYAVSAWHDPEGMQRARGRMVVNLTRAGYDVTRTCLPGSEPILERIFRSFIFLPNTLRFSWEKEFCSIGDARFDLALAVTPMIQKTPSAFEMRELFISYHEADTHNVVWMELITLAAYCGAFRLRDPKVTPGDHARFISVMLPTGLLRIRTTLQEGLALSEPAIWDYLIEMPSLSPFDVGPSSSSSTPYRVLLAAAKFALHHIEKDPASERSRVLPESKGDGSSSSMLQCHWTLLETVLDRFASGDFYPSSEPLEGLVLVTERAVALSGLVDSRNDSDEVPLPVPSPRHDKCMSSILQIYSDIRVAGSSPSTPRILRASVARLLYNLDSQYNQHHLDEALFFSILRSTTEIMLHLLSSSDCHEAYHIFVHDKWIHHFGPLWVVGWARGWPWLGQYILNAYISGLASPSMASSRHEFIDHLHEPENLAIATCVLRGSAEWLRKLVELNPTHASWERCWSIVEDILAWNANPTTDFPAVDLVRGVVVQCSDRAIPLEEHLRTWFAGDEARVDLEEAMQILNATLHNSQGNT